MNGMCAITGGAILATVVSVLVLEALAVAFWHAFVTSGARKDEPGDEWGPVLKELEQRKDEEGGGK